MKMLIAATAFAGVLLSGCGGDSKSSINTVPKLTDEQFCSELLKIEDNPKTEDEGKKARDEFLKLKDTAPELFAPYFDSLADTLVLNGKLNSSKELTEASVQEMEKLLVADKLKPVVVMQAYRLQKCKASDVDDESVPGMSQADLAKFDLNNADTSWDAVKSKVLDAVTKFVESSKQKVKGGKLLEEFKKGLAAGGATEEQIQCIVEEVGVENLPDLEKGGVDAVASATRAAATACGMP